VALYRPNSGLIIPHKPSPLRTGRTHRKAHSRVSLAGRRFAQPMLSIHERCFPPQDRSEAGHWEGDLIVGPRNRSAIATLVERQTRCLVLLKMETFTSIALHDVLVAWSRQLPPALRKSLTWDQGKEMSKHLETTARTGMKVFFCDRASPWQRGTNENTNGLIRQYFPKSTDLSKYTEADLARVQRELN
jgi:IS30 family transposase